VRTPRVAKRWESLGSVGSRRPCFRSHLIAGLAILFLHLGRRRLLGLVIVIHAALAISGSRRLRIVRRTPSMSKQIRLARMGPGRAQPVKITVQRYGSKMWRRCRIGADALIGIQRSTARMRRLPRTRPRPS
jgi:hypothetical protein